jgi:hypothetical protein
VIRTDHTPRHSGEGDIAGHNAEALHRLCPALGRSPGHRGMGPHRRARDSHGGRRRPLATTKSGGWPPVSQARSWSSWVHNRDGALGPSPTPASCRTTETRTDPPSWVRGRQRRRVARGYTQHRVRPNPRSQTPAAGREEGVAAGVSQRRHPAAMTTVERRLRGRCASFERRGRGELGSMAMMQRSRVGAVTRAGRGPPKGGASVPQVFVTTFGSGLMCCRAPVFVT